MTIGVIIILIIIFLIVIIAFKAVKIVNQSTVYVVERLGKYNSSLQSGLHIINPFLDRVVLRIDIREQVLNFDPQPVITKDNVTMQIDTVIYAQVTDPKRYMYGVGNAVGAIENLTATTLRNIIGELELDETLTSRDVINSRIRATLDESTSAWGMKVTRVEVKNIIPPEDIQVAMEKQMRAEREKREKVLVAEGMKISSITEAEGLKESRILKAEGEKQQKILIAEGDAQAIKAVQFAYAESLERLNKAEPSEAILKLKGYEAFEKMADGQASKLIIPSELSGIANLSAAFKEATNFVEDKK